MCIVCILIAKEKITRREAMTALYETIQTAEDKSEVDHIQELYGQLEKEERESNG